MPRRSLNRCGVAAVKHCNLSCTACNHLSPIFKASVMDPGVFETVTKTLSRYVSFNWLVLQGGEPLLHPEIDQLIKIAKASGLAPRVSVLTNGTLLDRMSSEFFNTIDLIELSAYPGIKVPKMPETVQLKMKVSDLDSFTESFSTIRNDDMALVWKIKERCHLFQRCYAISGDHFYKCIIASFIPEKIPHPFLDPQTVDGIKVEDRKGFGYDLEAYIDDIVPLRSCEFCAGTIGKRFPQTQTSRADWLKRHQRPVQEMLDRALLARLPKDDPHLRRDLGIPS